VPPIFPGMFAAARGAMLANTQGRAGAEMIAAFERSAMRPTLVSSCACATCEFDEEAMRVSGVFMARRHLSRQPSALARQLQVLAPHPEAQRARILGTPVPPDDNSSELSNGEEANGAAHSG